MDLLQLCQTPGFYPELEIMQLQMAGISMERPIMILQEETMYLRILMRLMVIPQMLLQTGRIHQHHRFPP